MATGHTIHQQTCCFVRTFGGGFNALLDRGDWAFLTAREILQHLGPVAPQALLRLGPSVDDAAQLLIRILVFHSCDLLSVYRTRLPPR
ncbi:MAG: hypothetical protein AW09_004307 [Candidatus Accumulibacter phosphatis]|uniref:Uncharacterized protein n=1 Tax=Candidatus Accumulibacter phosphatis TaxID=327160 RepID=A0A080M057_9PROT|nr:MAG: hypothetical protein AW09_004307 [Candidatus Accumulibacter phosphatis]